MIYRVFRKNYVCLKLIPNYLQRFEKKVTIPTIKCTTAKYMPLKIVTEPFENLWNHDTP